ncbi:unnamed protein product [Arabidopsis thaliana]|uniref:(thale cress) hypothetical protein n=1 Tax=Arabidopsis thaliana TaxID=3702 RepID=A0A7G2FAK5_ARATH|nr:unnamed protein product [Arabidopsis thaliana]
MDQLSEKQIWYYHIIPEYQTEKSFYACVRRSGMIKFDTFYFPHMLSARETQRSIKFGDGVWSGCLYDPDIYTDATFTPSTKMHGVHNEPLVLLKVTSEAFSYPERYFGCEDESDEEALVKKLNRLCGGEEMEQVPRNPPWV